MSAEPARVERERPLVVLVSSVPLLAEAVRSELDFAEVVCFADRGGDVADLLRWLQPDVLLIDGARTAADAEAYASAHGLPVLHISVRERSLRLFGEGTWRPAGGGAEPTPEAIRHAVAGALYARTGAAS